MLIQDDMPKYEQAYYTLINRLKSNRYPVGSRIPTEGDLAQQFSMSRVTTVSYTHLTLPTKRIV